jgi:light-regulated signal transduction histidine kinase (bacteriophytochrome)
VEASATRALLVLVSGTVASMVLLAVVFVLLRREIGQRTRVEAELRLRTADLETANKGLEAFSYSVSHDLRNPLGVIEGFSELLLEEYGNTLDETANGYLQRLRAVAGEMDQLIKDLLQFSLAQRSELQREQVDLSAIADTVAAELREMEPDRQVTFAIARGLRAVGDRGLLDAVLRNLLGNAWKFTKKQPQARIEVGAVQQDGRPAYFVRDNGIGFNKDEAQKVFGAFQRLPAAHEFGGSGIGLATVQRIIQRHGGRVWAEAVTGQGATFYFTL